MPVNLGEAIGAMVGMQREVHLLGKNYTVGGRRGSKKAVWHVLVRDNGSDIKRLVSWCLPALDRYL